MCNSFIARDQYSIYRIESQTNLEWEREQGVRFTINKDKSGLYWGFLRNGLVEYLDGGTPS